MKALLLLALSVVVAQGIGAQGKTPAPAKTKGKPCLIDLLSSEHEGRQEGNAIMVGGNVKLACHGQDVTLAGDSLISLNGYDVVTLIGNVKYHDEKYDMLADTLRRYAAREQITLVGNVHITERKTGSTLVGPSVDYVRTIPGVKDTNQIVAIGRPTATIRAERTARTKGTPSPYILIADRLVGWGSDKINAYGMVSLERDSLRVTGDSLNYISGKGKTARVFGAPAKVEELVKDSVRVQGKRVIVGFAEDESVRDIQAAEEGTLVRDGATITADTLLLGVKDDKLNSILAWGTKWRAHLARDGYDTYSDSLATETESGHIDELRLFYKGIVYQPLDVTPGARRDSLAGSDRNWLSGERVTVSFRQVDSAGTTLTIVNRLLAASGTPSKTPSCSFFTKKSAPAKAGSLPALPTLTYACAESITVRMKSGLAREVDDVAFRNQVNGVQLQPKGRGGSTKTERF